MPTWDFHGSWGNPEIYWRAGKYVMTHFPFWNASGGADHIFVNTRDAAACSNPWGSIHRETASAMVFSNWGSVTGLGGVPVERCFDARKDVVLPACSRSHRRALALLRFSSSCRRDPAAAAVAPTRACAAAARRGRRDGSRGAAAAGRRRPGRGGRRCSSSTARSAGDYDHVRGMRALERKCRQKHGFLDHYSFNVRYEVYRRFKDEPRFVLRATDLIPAPRAADLDELTLSSVFCLCPSGTGWGMRAFHAVALGCIPVIIQDDGSGKYPSVLQAFEGLLLDWSHFGVAALFRPAAAAEHTAPARGVARRARREARWPRRRADRCRGASRCSAVRACARRPDAFDSVMQTLLLRQESTAAWWRWRVGWGGGNRSALRLE